MTSLTIHRREPARAPLLAVVHGRVEFAGHATRDDVVARHVADIDLGAEELGTELAARVVCSHASFALSRAVVDFNRALRISDERDAHLAKGALGSWVRHLRPEQLVELCALYADAEAPADWLARQATDIVTVHTYDALPGRPEISILSEVDERGMPPLARPEWAEAFGRTLQEQFPTWSVDWRHGTYRNPRFCWEQRARDRGAPFANAVVLEVRKDLISVGGVVQETAVAAVARGIASALPWRLRAEVGTRATAATPVG